MNTDEICGTCRHLNRQWSPYMGNLRVHFWFCHRRHEQRNHDEPACQYHERKGQSGPRQIDDERELENRESVA